MPKAGAYSVGQRWTVEEEDLLKEFYPKYGAAYVSRLLGRSRYGVLARASRLEVKLQPRWRPHWKEEEIEVLKREQGRYGKRSSRTIATMLGRSKLGIISKTRLLGLSTPPKKWSKRELTLLRTHYGKMPTAELVRKIGRDAKSIISMASARGLSKPKPTLTPKQRKFIARNLGKLSFKTIAERLGISQSPVRTEADRIGYQSKKGPGRLPEETASIPPKRSRNLKQWTQQDDALLAEHYPLRGSHYTAALLGRSQKATSERARLLGITANAFSGRWSQDEDHTLRKLYRKKTLKEIAAEMNRTFSSVAARVHTLGLAAERRRNSDSEA